MEAIPLLIPLIAVGAVFAVKAIMQSGTRPAWQLVAQRLGLAFTPAGLLQQPKMEGSIDGYEVVVDITTKGSGNSRRSYTRYVVTGHRISSHVAFASETFWSALDLMGEEILIGDGPFDDAVRVRGVESNVLAVLDQPTRDLLSQYIAFDKGHVKDGRIECERAGHERNETVLEERIRRMVEVAKALSIRDADVTARLAGNVEADGVPTVRLRNLAYLTKFYRRSPECETAMSTALDDGAAEVRLHAAKAIGARGMPVLEALTTSPTVQPELRADALDHLSSRLPREDLETVVAKLIGGADEVLEVRALRLVAKESLGALAPKVKERLDATNKKVVAAAARALGFVGSDDHEHRLVILLEHDDDDVKTAACAALANVGTINAVEPLLEHTKGIFKDGDLKRAARSAVESIQSRVQGGADGGRLSVVQTAQEGALSESKDAGAVAIVDED